jgi:hypothetical protein
VLVFAIGGLIWSVWRKCRIGVLLGLWAGLGALLLMLTPGRVPSDVLCVLLPLSLLAGLAVTGLADDLRILESRAAEGVHAVLVVVLWGYLAMRLLLYATGTNPREFPLALLTIALQLLFAAALGVATRPAVAARGLAIGTAAVLLAATVSAGWGLNHMRPADPRELLAHDPTAAEVRDLVNTLEDLSLHRTGTRTELPFTFAADADSVLAWYLRNFSVASRDDSLSPASLREGTLGDVLVTQARSLAVETPYRGQSFPLRRSWNHSVVNCTLAWPLECRHTAKWLLFRDSSVDPPTDGWAVLWVADEGTLSGQGQEIEEIEE